MDEDEYFDDFLEEAYEDRNGYPDSDFYNDEELYDDDSD